MDVPPAGDVIKNSANVKPQTFGLNLFVTLCTYIKRQTDFLLVRNVLAPTYVQNQNLISNKAHSSRNLRSSTSHLWLSVPCTPILHTIWPMTFTVSANTLWNNLHVLYIGFEALHGEVSMYIWFAVTPCVYLLAR